MLLMSCRAEGWVESNSSRVFDGAFEVAIDVGLNDVASVGVALRDAVGL
jgi:hypothetical protein